VRFAYSHDFLIQGLHVDVDIEELICAAAMHTSGLAVMRIPQREA
jgi:hypothetical protein